MINPQTISKSLDKYALETLKIKDKIYDELRIRRNQVVELVESYVEAKENFHIKECFNLGSYKIRTGVMYYDNDYDIDYAIAFDKFDLLNAENFKKNLRVFLSKNLKERWKKYKNVIVKNNKKVITIKFMNDHNEQAFHLDLPFYFKEDDCYYLVFRDSLGKYYTKQSYPKEINKRQTEALNPEQNRFNSRRNAIILLKHLMSRNHIEGISSIYITDKIISFPIELDTFSLMKRFFESAKNEISFTLKEEKDTNLILDSQKLNDSAHSFWIHCFNETTTKEAFMKLEQKFNNKLPPLELEKGSQNIDIYHGGKSL